MGNNLQALRTAKALTKQLSSDDSYVKANNNRDLEIQRQNCHSNLSLSMSLESSPDSVTEGQTSTEERQKTKESMTRRTTSNQPEYLNGLNTNHKRDTNSFVYYVPQMNTPSLQDGHFEEELNILQNKKQPSMKPQGQSKSKSPTLSKPVVVDLTLDDSDADEQETISNQTENSTSTFPKILAAYSLNSGNTPFPASDLCTLLSQKAKENQTKTNGSVLNAFDKSKSSALIVDSCTLKKNKPTNGLVFQNRPKTYNIDISNQRASLVNGILNNSSDNNQRNSTSPTRSSNTSSMIGHKIGVMNAVTNSSNQVRPSITFKNDVTNHSDQSRIANVANGVANNKNDVMNDVTNTWNGIAHEYKPILFSSLSKTVESRSSDTETSSSESGDNVVITKVVTPAEHVGVRSSRKHPRKEPIKVRQLYFEQEASNHETTNSNAPINKKRSISSTSTQELPRKKRRVDEAKDSQSAQHSQWSVDDTSQKIADRLSPSNIHREAKIRTLKNLLAKQEMAVQKMRTKDSGRPSLVSNDRVLVVEIPDLKSELHLPKDGKHSFRISSQTISLSPNDNDVPRKRPRKRDPRKITRQDDSYPSYVEAKALLRLHDNDDDFIANKKLKGKSRGKSRGRCSPKPNKPTPVVIKDAWHQELEKAEALQATSDRPMDQATFMVFLGLKPV